jgi:hypothetical protein
VIYNDTSEWLSCIFQHNLNVFYPSSDKFRILNQNAEDLIQRLPEEIDLMIDPDRRSKSVREYFFRHCSPDVTQLAETLHQRSGKTLIKASPMIDLRSGIRELKGCKEIHVLAVQNEVKEVLFLIDPAPNTEDPLITTANHLNREWEEFSFRLSEESDCPSPAVTENFPGFLLEPNAALLKAGAFKTLGNHFQLTKISANTHLYGAEEMIEFPGKIYQVLARAEKKQLKKWAPDGKINVVCRNHPLKPDQIKSRYRLKDGGDLYLLCYRDHQQQPIMVVAKTYRP